MSMARRCAVLTAAVVLVSSIATPIAWSRLGTVGLKTACLAALVCLIAGCLGLVLTLFGRRTASPMMWFLLGDGASMGIPLTVALLVQQARGPLFEAGYLMWTVAFFLTTLAVKTCFLAPGAGESTSTAGLSPTQRGKAGA